MRAPAEPRLGTLRRASGVAGALGVAGAVLTPKCPLCAAAALSALGLGSLAPALGAWLLPAAWTLALGALGVLGGSVLWRRALAPQGSREPASTVVQALVPVCGRVSTNLLKAEVAAENRARTRNRARARFTVEDPGPLAPAFRDRPA